MRDKIRNLLENEVITAKETGRSDIRMLIRRGKVEAVKVGTVWLLDKKDFEKTPN